MECTYLSKDECESGCARYGLNLAACSLEKSLRGIIDVTKSESNAMKIVEGIKPYMMSIHTLSEDYGKENHWNEEHERFQALIDNVLDNSIISIVNVKSTKNSKFYRDTKISSEREIEKLKSKIEETIPQLEELKGMHF